MSSAFKGIKQFLKTFFERDVQFILYATTTNGESVQVAGSWNDWKVPLDLEYNRDSSCWIGTIRTNFLTVEYKYIICPGNERYWESGQNRERVVSAQCSPDYWCDENFKYDRCLDKDSSSDSNELVDESKDSLDDGDPSVSHSTRSLSADEKLSHLKVLYITPEFPPQINGGLGEASFNICKSLCKTTDLHLVIPKLPTESTVFDAFTPKSTIYMDDGDIQTFSLFSLTYLSSSSSYRNAYRCIHGCPPQFKNMASYVIDDSLQQQCIDTNFDVIHVSDWITVDSGIALKRKQENH
ncbi:hypothetical protein GEMRC1_006989 [Eukaryota sp. GEM-RC1]